MKKQKFIYLDNNATTPVDPIVFDAMRPFFCEVYGNPSSSHNHGIQASVAVESGRTNLKQMFNITDGDLYFTSSATESINLSIAGLAYANYPSKNHLITQATEHPAVLETFNHLAKLGFEITVLPVDSTGIVNPDDVKNAIKKETLMVSVMGANNEIGALQVLRLIGEICNSLNVIFHSDVTQFAGRYPLDMKALNLDLISGGAHKIHGPKGIGYLAVNKKDKIKKINPLLFGGGQEKGLSPGTLNTPLVVGLSRALSLMAANQGEENDSISNLRNTFLSSLEQMGIEFEINGSRENRLYNNLSIRFPGMVTHEMIADLRQISFSSGSACASESGNKSHVLKAIGLNNQDISSTARFGFSRFNTVDEIIEATTVIGNYIKLKRKK
ncbi:IscS subfamily cysteine desulfurase [Ignavibacteriales bacterium]